MRASLDGRNPIQIRQGLDKPRAIVLYKPTRFVSRDCCALLLTDRPGALANPLTPPYVPIMRNSNLEKRIAGYFCLTQSYQT